MEPLRHRSGSISRTEPFHFEHRRGIFRWAKRNVKANLPVAGVVLTVVAVIIFLLWMVSVIFTNRVGGAPEIPSNRVIQFAMDELRRMSSGDIQSLQLLSVVSHRIIYEKLPGLDEPIDTVDDLVLRLGSKRNAEIVFDHHITISTDSSGLSAVTKYSCSYDSSERRYPGVILPGYASATSESQSKPTPIRVLSVNTWNYNHWVKRLPLLQDVLDVYLPDIVTFQEVRARKVSSEGRNRFMVEDIRFLLPHMQFIFEPAMRFREGDEIVHEGVAIFSRFPIIDYSKTKLSQNPTDTADFHTRIALRAGIVWGYALENNEALHVVTTHLSLSESARRRTLPEVHEVVQKASAGGTYPVILTGDFNAEGISAERNLPTMQDAWAVTHPGQEDSQDGYTFNSWFPKSRIDYIFSKGLKTLHCSVVGGGKGVLIPEGVPPGFGVGNTRDVLYPSDHMFPFAILAKE